MTGRSKRQSNEPFVIMSRARTKIARTTVVIANEAGCVRARSRGTMPLLDLSSRAKRELSAAMRARIRGIYVFPNMICHNALWKSGPLQPNFPLACSPLFCYILSVRRERSRLPRLLEARPFVACRHALPACVDFQADWRMSDQPSLENVALEVCLYCLFSRLSLCFPNI